MRKFTKNIGDVPLALLLLAFTLGVIPLEVVGVMWLFGYEVNFFSAFIAVCMIYASLFFMNTIVFEGE